MGVWKKSSQEIEQHLAGQRAALRSSCEAYDRGQTWEAVRIAAAVDILVHDRGTRTLSILTQLGVRSQIQFVSSRAMWNPKNRLAETPLVYVDVQTSGASYHPILDQDPLSNFGPLPFSKWWEEPVIRDRHLNELTRKNLVCSMRDQDGGAHVDGTLTNGAYVSIARSNGTGWTFMDAIGERPVEPGPQFATMRQIGWEVEHSLSNIKQ